MPETELHDDLQRGDLDAVKSRLDAGADVRYVRDKGYTAPIDLMYGRVIATDEQLLPILRLLIERGADLDAATEYRETALAVASNNGRFDAVAMLLDAGADPAPLHWTPLLRAVAVGTLDDVHARIAEGSDLEARDNWDRTPWLLSLQTGDVEKARMLSEAGALREARGRCGKTPLMYPIPNRHAAMLRWLLEDGADPDATDDFGGSPLLDAAEYGDVEGARLLLDAGADIDYAHDGDSAIRAAGNLDVLRLLVARGADLNDVNDDLRAVLTRLPNDGSIACTPADYQAAPHRVFGVANPQRMNFPFWKAMVSGGGNAYQARTHFQAVKARYEAVWCFRRFGKSINELPDGRIIEIAGEHEDYYDQDFCIYNDVVVHQPEGGFDIYGYPADVFPPTDFHTATLVGRSILVIGGLGYQGSRAFGTTPIYRLDIDTLAITPVTTSGDLPGWINRHRARLLDDQDIEVSGGKVCRLVGEEEVYEDNPDTYVLHLPTLAWTRQPRSSSSNARSASS